MKKIITTLLLALNTFFFIGFLTTGIYYADAGKQAMAFIHLFVGVILFITLQLEE